MVQARKIPDEIWELCPGWNASDPPSHARQPANTFNAEITAFVRVLLFSRQKYMIPGRLYTMRVSLSDGIENGRSIMARSCGNEVRVYAIDHGLSMQDASGITFQELLWLSSSIASILI